MMTWYGDIQTFTVWSAEQETILPSSLEKLQQYTTSVCPVIDSSSLPEWLSHTLNKQRMMITHLVKVQVVQTCNNNILIYSECI